MCGIAGILNFGGTPEQSRDIAAMARQLAHRGPDGTRVYVDNNIALGHSRLRVIDLSEKADQPLFNENQTVGIVLNGEIYNFAELRSELVGEGVTFRTRSDTEVALKLYEHLGVDFLCRLDGMFAIAIWDGRSQTLLLARDRAGKKPLFLYQDTHRIAFASEVKALQRHPQISVEPDCTVLPFYLTYGYVPAPNSFYKRIRVLLPGSYLAVAADGSSTEKFFWQPSYLQNGSIPREAAEERLRELLTRAVHKRLVADVPLGAFLSGGLDSTVVVGLMSRLMDSRVKTFSVGYANEPQYDETEYALLAARRFGTDHSELRLPPPTAELIDKLVYFHDGPFGDSSAIPSYQVSELSRQQVTVVLNGDGGDELFAGYLRFWAAKISELFPRWLSWLCASSARFLPDSLSHRHPAHRLKRWATVLNLPLSERYLAWVGYFASDIPEIFLQPEKRIERKTVVDHVAGPLEETETATTLSRILFMNFKTYLPEDLLVKVDRCSMAHGLEARSPFLDTDLIEFTTRLPDSFKMTFLDSKVLLRRAFKDMIPDQILKRPKMGFGVPLGPWLRGPLRSYLLDKIGHPSCKIYQHLKRDKIENYLSAHLSGERDFGHQLFCLLTLEIWLRKL